MTETPALILVVDDEPKNVKLLEAQLLPLGYDVVSACNGAEALEQVSRNRPNLILLDIMMPIMNGFEVCKYLKDDADTCLIPVVIMTALGAVEDRVRGIEAGADDFLTKPVDFDELTARIRNCLRLQNTVGRKFEELEQVRDHYSKFVPDVVKTLIADNPRAPALEKVSRDVSVLFIDIVGYTRLNEEYDPEHVGRLVEQYFSAFLDLIHDACGEIKESSGDGLMVIFQDIDPERHALQAADTALALFKVTEQLNADNPLEPFALHMGLNSGTAQVGSSRLEGKRGTRWVFTADGPVTNLAARLASVAEADNVLMGPESARRLMSRYPVQSCGPMRLKNISEPIEVYRISRPTAPSPTP